MRNAIEVENLSKTYPSFALKDVTFSLPCGSIMGFIGENGAGKTTTIKAMLGLITRDAGTVRMLGQAYTSENRELAEQIGVVFDANNFHENLTTRDVSQVLRRIYKSWDDADFQKYCRLFSLPANKTVHELSRGMKMKLSLAAALSHHPRLLILDEATSGLDPVVREELLDLFMDFIQDEDHSILLSSHITSDLDKVADYITFLHEGRVVFSREKDELTDSMGIVRCRRDELKNFGPTEAIRYREGQFGCEVLVGDRRQAAAKHPGCPIDRVSIEEIMLLYSRGKAL